ncbi:MAG: type II toxin-antitoxin system prevent-host-death family antitoxin [Gordonia sp. (in: high G+C Gram-positive bacteria)]|uniref:type II toxin-antitoxin system Phd/YefM family antitoxin n=1 Tax=Gordonia sp. (in: high G+C Gram-positive bacteria) TaxID=84139 RepID=UPI0039E5B6EB
MKAITTTDARKNLFTLVAQLSEDHDSVEIVGKNGSTVMMSKEDYDSLMETQYLLASPANAIRLLRSLEQTRSGQTHEHDLSELDL